MADVKITGLRNILEESVIVDGTTYKDLGVLISVLLARLIDSEDGSSITYPPEYYKEQLAEIKTESEKGGLEYLSNWGEVLNIVYSRTVSEVSNKVSIHSQKLIDYVKIYVLPKINVKQSLEGMSGTDAMDYYFKNRDSLIVSETVIEKLNDNTLRVINQLEIKGTSNFDMICEAFAKLIKTNVRYSHHEDVVFNKRLIEELMLSLLTERFSNVVYRDIIVTTLYLSLQDVFNEITEANIVKYISDVVIVFFDKPLFSKDIRYIIDYIERLTSNKNIKEFYTSTMVLLFHKWFEDSDILDFIKRYDFNYSLMVYSIYLQKYSLRVNLETLHMMSALHRIKSEKEGSDKNE